MLSSPLLNFALPERAAAGRDAVSAERAGASTSFGDLLAAGLGSEGEEGAETGAAEQPTAVFAAPIAAVADMAAIETGKILPVALPVIPNAAIADDGEDGGEIHAATEIDTGAEIDAGALETTEASPASGAGGEPILSGLPQTQSHSATAPRAKAHLDDEAPASQSHQAPTPQQAAKTAPATSGPATASPAPAPTQLAAVSIAVQIDKPEGKAASAALPIEAAAVIKGAPTPAPAPIQPVVSASLEPSVSTPAALPTAPVAQPAAAADLAAVLDRLVAAREALLPAQATLDIKHADFGDISLRFAQSPLGALSVEMASADPELQRAVNVALASERAQTGAGESDGNRSFTGSGQNRGTAADREAATGGEPEARQGRERPGHRAADTSGGTTAQAPTRSGIFA